MAAPVRERVVVTNRVHQATLDLLAPRLAVVANRGSEPWPRARLIDQAADAGAIIAFMTDAVDDAFLAACPRLRLIAAALKGHDNFDVGACTRHGVRLTIVPDLLTPHLGSAVASVRRDIELAAARNVLRWLDGEALVGCVNPEAVS